MINGLPLAGLLSNPAPCSLLGLARSLAASSSVWQCLHSAVGPTSSAVAAASPVAGRAFSTAAAAAQSGRPAAAAAASVPVERLQRIITPQLCDSLRRNGFAGAAALSFTRRATVVSPVLCRQPCCGVKAAAPRLLSCTQAAFIPFSLHSG